MQKKNKKTIKSCKNLYCDAIRCALGEFLEVNEEDIENLTKTDIENLIEYAVIKNKKAGVSELFIKVPYFGVGIKMLDKYGLKGSEIVSALQMNNMPASALVGERLILEVDNILDYNEPFLSDLKELSARGEIPILFKLGQNLEDVGKIVNKFSCSPAEVLESYGFLDGKCYIYGANFIDKEDQKLLKDYGVEFILSPRSDGEEGLGAINLYNFIYNQLKFCFSSGKCYNIDMFGECKLAKINTSNLMFDSKLISVDDLLSAIESEENEEILIDFDNDSIKETILDAKININVEEYETLREKVKQIAKNLKEKR